VDEILDLFEEYGLEAPGTRHPVHQARHQQLELCAGYVRGSSSVGSSDEIAARLPIDAAWRVWEDPAYEHLGQAHLHHPDLGHFAADCDAQGWPVFTSNQVDRLFTVVAGDQERLRDLTGATWMASFYELRLVNTGVFLPRDNAEESRADASARLQASAFRADQRFRPQRPSTQPPLTEQAPGQSDSAPGDQPR